MLVSALFFVSHTAIVGNGLASTDPSTTDWWYLGLMRGLLESVRQLEAAVGRERCTELTVRVMAEATEDGVHTAIILIGQAIVQFEVFTGKLLPQRRSMRHWRNIITLAVAYSAIMSGGVQLHIHPGYSLVLGAILLTLSYPMFSRASTLERQRYIRQL